MCVIAKDYTNTSFRNIYFVISNNFKPGTYWMCPRGVMVQSLEIGIVVSKFVLQSRYYIHFRKIPLGKGINHHIFPVMG